MQVQPNLTYRNRDTHSSATKGSSFATWPTLALYLYLQDSQSKNRQVHRRPKWNCASTNPNQSDDRQRRLRDELQKLLRQAHEINLDRATNKGTPPEASSALAN